MTNYVDMHGWTISARRFSAPIREGFHYFGAWQGTDYIGPCNTADEVWQEIADIRAELRPERSSAGGSQWPIYHDAAEYERASIIALAKRLDESTLDAYASAAGPGRYEGADDLALVVALDILSVHGCADDRAGSTEYGLYLERFGRYVLATDDRGFVSAYRFESVDSAQADLDAEDIRQEENSGDEA